MYTRMYRPRIGVYNKSIHRKLYYSGETPFSGKIVTNERSYKFRISKLSITNISLRISWTRRVNDTHTLSLSLSYTRTSVTNGKINTSAAIWCRVLTDFAIVTTTLLISRQCPRWTNDDEEGREGNFLLIFYRTILLQVASSCNKISKEIRVSNEGSWNRYFSKHFSVEANIHILLIKSFWNHWNLIEIKRRLNNFF